MAGDLDIAELDATAELEQLRKANRALQVKLVTAKAKTAEMVEAVYQASKDAAVVLGRPPAVPKPKADKRTRKAEVALLHLSDLHFGKATSTFNTEVARARLELLTSKVLKITEIERADHPVRDCHVALGGDLAENIGIFPGQIYEIDSATFAQVFAAVGSLEILFRSLFSTFDRVVVNEVWGNHGRIGRKGDNPRGDNIDRLIGRILLDRLQEFGDRLTWYEPTGGWYSIIEAGEYRALLIHGDQIKSFGGNVPAFGIVRKVNAWATGVLPPFTDCYLGHFHQPMRLQIANGKGRSFVNPSIESDSHYAKEFVAANGTPGQRLHFVDPVEGRVTSLSACCGWTDDPDG